MGYERLPPPHIHKYYKKHDESPKAIQDVQALTVSFLLHPWNEESWSSETEESSSINTQRKSRSNSDDEALFYCVVRKVEVPPSALASSLNETKSDVYEVIFVSDNRHGMSNWSVQAKNVARKAMMVIVKHVQRYFDQHRCEHWWRGVALVGSRKQTFAVWMHAIRCACFTSKTSLTNGYIFFLRSMQVVRRNRCDMHEVPKYM